MIRGEREMNILVCLKQVPDPGSELVLDPETGSVGPRDSARYVINPSDEYALELALRLKDDRPGSSVEAASVGPGRALKVLDRARGMGADRARLLESGELFDSLSAARRMAEDVRNRNHDLILTGISAGQGVFGPALARLLGRPWLAGVLRAKMGTCPKTIMAWRESDGGLRELLEVDLPALMTVQTGPDQPRYPKLSNMLRARSEKPEIIPDGNRVWGGESVKILDLRWPPRTRVGQVLEGSIPERAERLAEILRERGSLS